MILRGVVILKPNRMKKWMLACLMMAGLSVAAQRMPGQGHGRQHRQEFSAEQMATLQSKQMTLALDLSSAQEKQLQQLLASRIGERRATREARMKDSTALANPQGRYEHMNAHLDSEIAFRRALKKILGEQQYEQWRQMHGKRRMGHPPGRKFRKG